MLISSIKPRRSGLDPAFWTLFRAGGGSNFQFQGMDLYFQLHLLVNDRQWSGVDFVVCFLR